MSICSCFDCVDHPIMLELSECPADRDEIDSGGTNSVKKCTHFETGRVLLKQMINRHGYNLAIFPGGIVKGVRDAFHPYAVLEIITAAIGEVHIRGYETGLYLRYQENGRLDAVSGLCDDSTVFLEVEKTPYLAFLSKKYSSRYWYLNLKKSGKSRRHRPNSDPEVVNKKGSLYLYRSPFEENPVRGTLVNRHGLTLVINEHGAVRGVSIPTSFATGNDRNEKDSALLHFYPSHQAGYLRIKSVKSDMYLAMGASGKLYGERERSEESTLFQEIKQNDYYLYLSAKFSHLGWYVGLKKSGKPKPGPLTMFPAGQKAIQFVKSLSVSGESPKGLFESQPIPSLPFIDDELN